MSLLRTTLTSIALLAAMFITAQSEITWLETEHDFGVINENDGDATCEFRFVNTGTDSVTIVRARASCGCTTPKYSQSPIAPGDTTIISVSYDPVGRPGRFKKSIYINTSASDERETLQVSGVVIAAEQTVKVRYPVEAGPLRLRRSLIALGEVDKGKSKTEFLDAYNVSRDTVYPKWINVPDYYTVLSAPKAIPPGEQATFTFYFNSVKCPTWDRVADTLSLVPAEGVTPIDILSVATIEENFKRLTPGERMNAPAIAVSPQRIDLGIINRSDDIITKEITIENFGKRTLELRRVYAYNANVDVSVNKENIKKGKTAKVTVKIDPSKIEGEYLNAHIIIIGNDPERPKTTVRITAEIKD